MDKNNQMEAYHQLSYYTLSHKDPGFIHQHIVDAFAAQTAEEKTKPIALTFALVGLYLMFEKGFTGKQVQEMHMKMAQYKKEWPTFKLPDFRGEITVMDVLSTPPGEARDTKIKDWCKSVWYAYKESHQKIADLLCEYLV